LEKRPTGAKGIEIAVSTRGKNQNIPKPQNVAMKTMRPDASHQKLMNHHGVSTTWLSSASNDGLEGERLKSKSTFIQEQFRL
jgi:hypothetical protein